MKNLLHFNRHVRRPIFRFFMLMALVMMIVLGLPGVLAASAQIPRKEAGLQSFPVVDNDIIYKGALVCVNTDGYLVPAADTVGYRFVGIAYEKVDNTITGHTAGGLNCRVYTEGTFQMTATSITQAMVGQPMYAVDDASMDDTSSAFVCVGRLVEYVSTTSGWVDIGKRGLTLDGVGAARLIAISLHDESGGVDYGELHINGATTGHIYGRGSWINIDDAGVPAAGHILVPFEGGVYADAAVLTNARIVFGGQHQAVLGSSPASLHCWRLNTNRTITALIAAGNSGSVGYVANATANSTKLGDIPFADIAGGVGVVYIRVYGAQT